MCTSSLRVIFFVTSVFLVDDVCFTNLLIFRPKNLNNCAEEQHAFQALEFWYDLYFDYNRIENILTHLSVFSLSRFSYCMCAYSSRQCCIQIRHQGLTSSSDFKCRHRNYQSILQPSDLVHRNFHEVQESIKFFSA